MKRTIIFLGLAALAEAAEPPLPGTTPLTAQGDLSAQMIAGADRFLETETARLATQRAARWPATIVADPAAYEKSVAANRQRFAQMIGLIDERPAKIELELIATPAVPAKVAETDSFTVYAIRWEALPGMHAEGLLLEPRGTAIARIVALPDADQTPEIIAGLASGLSPERQYARRLAENGCQVLVPTLVSRADTFSGNVGIKQFTNHPHREWIYRQSFVLGRHPIGYEVQKVRAAVDWFEGQNQAGRALRLAGAATALFDRLAAHLPSLIGAILLLAAGWLLARLLRVLAVRGMQLAETLIERMAGPSRLKVGRSANVLGTIVYWVVLLFFVTAATHVLGLQTFTDWLARLLDYLPTLAAGLLIIVAGYVLASFVADLVHATSTRLAPAQRTALARLAQGATLVAAILVGADQIGIRVTWIAILAAVVIAAVLGGVTLAVSLGARSYVANLIGAHYLRQAFQVGQRVRVAGFEGRIVEVSATSLVLESKEGRVALPGRVYHDEPIVLLTGENHG
jgi:hypothetical protein